MTAELERLKFADFEFERFPNGLCRARVDLQRRGGDDPYSGTFEGSGSATGALRCSAQASLLALAKAVGSSYSFELLGVKTVNADRDRGAFGAWRTDGASTRGILRLSRQLGTCGCRCRLECYQPLALQHRRHQVIQPPSWPGAVSVLRPRELCPTPTHQRRRR
jgi:hypothetical protein